MSWIKKVIGKVSGNNKNSVVPEGLWTPCNGCNKTLYTENLKKNLFVCPECDHHLRLRPRRRLASLFDEGTEQELFTEIESKDILKFKDIKRYKDRLKEAQASTEEKEAIIVAQGRILGLETIVCVFNFDFMGGSMGVAVGEKFTKAVLKALDEGKPLICFSASGGARMQEGLFSLMQMAKTSAILGNLKQKGIPFISVLTDPTFGGVSASLAMLGDINIAEPKALIGFAGTRVIEQTVREKLPENFQRAEFLLEKGFIDMIVHRKDMKNTLARLIAKLTNKPSPFVKQLEQK